MTAEIKALENAPQNEKNPYDVFEVGDKVRIRHYTDVTPATVIEVKRGGKHVTVQHDSYKLAKGEKPNIIPGGFSGHCTNQHALKYDITRNENGGKQTFTLRKLNGRYYWTGKGCRPDGHQRLAQGWWAFRDYNF